MRRKTTIIMNTSIIISNTTVNNGTMTGKAPHMTSLEIAEVTGKQHKHVMEAIRKMEPAWMNIAGSNFRLGSYKDANRQLRPCYQLTKTECLYIATKFNDEARAKLVLRWEELESEELRVKSEEFATARKLLYWQYRAFVLAVQNICTDIAKLARSLCLSRFVTSKFAFF
jgi:phage regulator Rha-like protein